jgi:hypothetical protein
LGIKKPGEYGKQTNVTSDHTLLALLKRLKAANNPSEIRQLSDQLERVIFHKQLKNA